ncbi:hypothetical protein D3C81_1835150 [compost metagenome]
MFVNGAAEGKPDRTVVAVDASALARATISFFVKVLRMRAGQVHERLGAVNFQHLYSVLRSRGLGVEFEVFAHDTQVHFDEGCQAQQRTH